MGRVPTALVVEFDFLTAVRFSGKPVFSETGGLGHNGLGERWTWHHRVGYSPGVRRR